MKSKEDARRILEAHESCCLDNEEDRERVLDALFDSTSTHKRTGVYEEVLGPGLAVRYRPEGFVGFIFLNPDDHPTFVPASELDPGWKDKLLKAIK